MQIESQIQTELQKVENDAKLSIIESKDCNFTMPVCPPIPLDTDQQSDFMNLSEFLDFMNDAFERGMDTICLTSFHNCLSPRG